MDESRANDGATVAVMLAVVLILLLLASAAAVYLWQRQARLQQLAVVEMERARAEAARAEAAERRLTQPVQREGRSDTSGPVQRPADSVEASIRALLESQRRAWNAGDIDQFMESYWKSDDLTFSSAGKVTRTWQGTLENYRKRYPSRAEMGELVFQNLEITPLGSDAAMVLGEWHLRRTSDELRGNFTLVMRRFGDQWLIVHDHTSRREAGD